MTQGLNEPLWGQLTAEMVLSQRLRSFHHPRERIAAPKPPLRRTIPPRAQIHQPCCHIL